ncbi:MAG: MarR family winged helix-turn-helix transcriptional regulator [Gemmatimonadaceae bacterium]
MNDSAIDQGACTGADADSGMLELLHVARILQSRIEAAIESVGLSIPKYQALEELIRCGEPVPLGQLADRQKCVRSNITQLVDRLAADGLVKRTDDPTDRRGVRAVITPLGQERFAAAGQAIRAVQESLTSKISKTDRANFLRILSAFRDE